MSIAEADAALIAVLKTARENARPLFEHFALEEKIGQWLKRPEIDLEAIKRSVVEALNLHPSFCNGRRRTFRSKQLMLSPSFIGHSVLAVCHKDGAAAATSWLHRIFAARQASIRYVLEVYGLSIQTVVTLSNGVQLMPLEGLPPSENATIVQRQFEIKPGLQPVKFERAIAAVLEIPDVQIDTDDNENGHSVELERTIRAFTLANDTAPVIGTCWSDFVDADLVRSEFGRSWFGPRHDGTLPHFPTPVDEHSVEWVERYLALSPDLTSVCDVAIERLNLARRRTTSGNQAIEAGICLEALLGDKGGQELSYKLKLRAALFLAKDMAARQEIMKAVNDLYTLRSATVHGRLPKQGKESQYDGDIATRGIGICSDTLRKIVQMNKAFEPSEWELTGGVPPVKSN